MFLHPEFEIVKTIKNVPVPIRLYLLSPYNFLKSQPTVTLFVNYWLMFDRNNCREAAV